MKLPNDITRCSNAEGIEIKEGREEWGAEKGVKYFVLTLGKIKQL